MDNKQSKENGKKETKENVKDLFEQGAIEQRKSVDTESQKEKDKKQK
ncbi:hypothetical protein [Fictibacillus terranigra]|uniref:DUF4025 domain-containing protein n=1 Tax=Fictibacillus terranigra TaxID=3058424 RepID=A0ABT8E3L6_9BACL|nr:hypothetical protein [Fictibacillus sp. CENA-BCM004]MDN4072497.1 hypothetical protein [Fictibacillus sp. CENA-BCM004]